MTILCVSFGEYLVIAQTKNKQSGPLKNKSTQSSRLQELISRGARGREGGGREDVVWWCKETKVPVVDHVPYKLKLVKRRREEKKKRMDKRSFSSLYRKCWFCASRVRSVAFI